MELAIAQSLQSAEERRADQRYEESASLLGFIDSLQCAETAAAAEPAPGGWARQQAASRDCDRNAGRALARAALESHLVSGGGM